MPVQYTRWCYVCCGLWTRCGLRVWPHCLLSSRLLNSWKKMSAQEIILSECYKGQGNTIFHFSLLHAERWIKNFILFISYMKRKYAGPDTPWFKNGTASFACWEARALYFSWWDSPTQMFLWYKKIIFQQLKCCFLNMENVFFHV